MMGASFSPHSDRRRKPDSEPSYSYSILFEGLNAVGKTTLLYTLKMGDVITTNPASTTGLNYMQISLAGTEVYGFDIGGRDKLRPLYRHFGLTTEGLVFVIDSTDTERLDDALDKLEFLALNEDEKWNPVVMVLANKQDIEGALSPEEIESLIRGKLSTCDPLLGRTLFVRGCSALTREGLEEAFSLFIQTIERRKAGRVAPGFKTHASLLEELKGKNGRRRVAGSVAKEMRKLCRLPSQAKSVLFY